MTGFKKISNYLTERKELNVIRHLWVCLLLLNTPFSFGQIIIQGIILSDQTKEPIVYANIGIAGSNVGTISNSDGSFILRIPQINLKDTLLIAALGFERLTIPINLFSAGNSPVFHLTEKVTLLKPVTIAAKNKHRTFEFGNTKVKGGVLETDTLYAGRSISLLIENANPEFAFPAFIENARLRIYRNNLAVIRFRIRVQAVDSLTKFPGDDLLQQSIVMESTIRKGWLQFDLTPLNFQVSKPFFITFEQLLDVNDRTSIANGYRNFINQHPEKIRMDTILFEGKKEVRQIIKGNGIDLPGTFVAIGVSDEHTCYVRETSLGAWKKVRGIVTATVTLSNQY